jgi:hypothetical protein
MMFGQSPIANVSKEPAYPWRNCFGNARVAGNVIKHRVWRLSGLNPSSYTSSIVIRSSFSHTIILKYSSAVRYFILRGKEIKFLHPPMHNFRRLLRPCISSHKHSRFPQLAINKIWRLPKHPTPPSGNRFCLVIRNNNLRLIKYLTSVGSSSNPSPRIRACKFYNLKIDFGNLFSFVFSTKFRYLNSFREPILSGRNSQTSISSSDRKCLNPDKHFSKSVLQLGSSRLVTKTSVLTRSISFGNLGRAWKKELECQQLINVWQFWKLGGYLSVGLNFHFEPMMMQDHALKHAF